MLYFFSWTILFAGLGNAAGELSDKNRYNVLFIAADDLRADLGCYGHSLVSTPHLDRLAARGLLFERAYCQQAVCNPSRASILTGRRIDSLRVWDLRTHFRETMPQVATLPEHFKNHGYFTQNIGKIYHNWLHEVQGDPQSWSVSARMHFAAHKEDTAQIQGPMPPNLASDPSCECREVPDEAYFDGRIAQLTVQALRERASDGQPFFLGVGFWKPHAPFNAPKKYWDMTARAAIPKPKNNQWPMDAPRIAWHDSRELLGSGRKARQLTDNAAREIRHGYLANIQYLDAQIGKVLDELDRLGLTERTIVVFWSDHGFHLGEHELWAKTSNFELDARVPLMIAIPDALTMPPRKGQAGGRTISAHRTQAIVELLDLYPTLCDLCGLNSPVKCEGLSLAPILRDPSKEIHEAALTQHPRPAYYQDAPECMGYTIRTASYRYTEWRDWNSGETIARELYDHRFDPGETKNLSEDETFQKELENHMLILARMQPAVRPGWSGQKSYAK